MSTEKNIDVYIQYLFYMLYKWQPKSELLLVKTKHLNKLRVWGF